MKLEQAINFEWQRDSQNKPDVPHFDELLKFLDLRAQPRKSYTRVSMKRAVKSKEFHVLNVASAHLTKWLKLVIASQPNQ